MNFKEDNLGFKFKTYRVIKLFITQITYLDALRTIFENAKNRSSSFFCFSNAHMMVEAKQNPEIAEAINNSTMTFSDGMSVVAGLKFIFGIRQDRIAGMDIIFDILKQASEKNIHLFLFGSEQKTLNKFIEKSKENYPNIIFSGAISPVFGEITDAENQTYITQINESKTQLVLVCLGCPKQELWMAKYHSKINATLLGIGGAVPMYVSEIKRAPLFLQKNYLEWLYRLIQEPKRLWKRYLITNSLYIYYVVIEIFKKKIFNKN